MCRRSFYFRPEWYTVSGRQAVPFCSFNLQQVRGKKMEHSRNRFFGWDNSTLAIFQPTVHATRRKKRKKSTCNARFFTIYHTSKAIRHFDGVLDISPLFRALIKRRQEVHCLQKEQDLSAGNLTKLPASFTARRPYEPYHVLVLVQQRGTLLQSAPRNRPVLPLSPRNRSYIPVQGRFHIFSRDEIETLLNRGYISAWRAHKKTSESGNVWRNLVVQV